MASIKTNIEKKVVTTARAVAEQEVTAKTNAEKVAEAKDLVDLPDRKQVPADGGGAGAGY